MNLLSHYYIDEAAPSEYFKLGVLMPELFSGFNKNLRKAVFATSPASNEHQQILNGIKKHIEIDAAFHNSKWFLNFQCLAKNDLKKLSAPALQFRSYFLAHVFLELLIDRQLIKQCPEIAVKMYDELGRIDPQRMSQFFGAIGKKEFESQFFLNFNRLISGKFLHFYTDNDFFVKTLLWVYQKINPAIVSWDEREKLKEMTEAFEAKHRHEIFAVFDQLPVSPAAVA